MDSLTLNVDADIYSESVVLKCIYWLTDIYSPEIKRKENSFVITIHKNDQSEFSSEEENNLKSKINQGLIDFKLREIVDKETRNIRELLIAKAFSHGEFDEEPPGEYEDPVGFSLD